MKIEYDFEYPLDAVAGLLTDPQFLVDRSIALGGLSAEGEVSEEDGRLEIVTTRELEQNLPAFIAKIMGSVQHMVVTEIWQQDGDGWSGTWDVDISGQPVSIHADFELMTTANGCRYSVSPNAKARIPLIGKKIENYLEGRLEQSLTEELGYTRDQLMGG